MFTYQLMKQDLHLVSACTCSKIIEMGIHLNVHVQLSWFSPFIVLFSRWNSMVPSQDVACKLCMMFIAWPSNVTPCEIHSANTWSSFYSFSPHSLICYFFLLNSSARHPITTFYNLQLLHGISQSPLPFTSCSMVAKHLLLTHSEASCPNELLQFSRLPACNISKAVGTVLIILRMGGQISSSLMLNAAEEGLRLLHVVCNGHRCFRAFISSLMTWKCCKHPASAARGWMFTLTFPQGQTTF